MMNDRMRRNIYNLVRCIIAICAFMLLAIEQAFACSIFGAGTTLFSTQTFSSSTLVPGQSFYYSIHVNRSNTTPASDPVKYTLNSVSIANATISLFCYTSSPFTTQRCYNSLAALNTQTATISVANAVPFYYEFYGTVTTSGSGSENVAMSVHRLDTCSAATTDIAAPNASYTEAAESRIDLQKSSVQAPVTGAITYTVAANNGGGVTAQGLASAQTLVGAAAPGIFLSDAVPVYAGAPLTLTTAVSVTTNTANGFPAAGTTPVVYYTTDSSAASGWTVAGGGVVPAGAYFIGVYLSGGASGPLDANAGSSDGNVPNAAVTFTYTIAQPSGSGTVTNIANAESGDNDSAVSSTVVDGTTSGVNTSAYILANKHLLAPGVAANSVVDSASSASLLTAGAALFNITYPGTPNGAASNIVTDSALAAVSGTVYNGPYGSAQAIGSYDGSVAVDITDHFMEQGFGVASATSTNSGTVAGSPAGDVTGVAVSNINVLNTLEDSGASAGTPQALTLTATAPVSPAGWTVQLFSVSGGVCSATPLTGSTAGATSTGTLSMTATPTSYCASYKAPAGTPTLARYDATISATDGITTGIEHNELYPGYIVLTKTQSATNTHCPAGVSPSPASAQPCPGDIISYTLDYRNIAQTGGTGNTEPAAAFSGVTTTAGSFVITDSGSVGTNNWASTTNGLNGSVSDTTAGTVFTYNPVAGTALAATGFSAQIGGAAATFAPGAQGMLNYSVTVK